METLSFVHICLVKILLRLVVLDILPERSETAYRFVRPNLVSASSGRLDYIHV